jgi:pyruvate dehydrogenase E1 component alpha subunit
MAEEKKKAIFTPTGGEVYQSTILPEPTSKKHKDLDLSKEDVIKLFKEMYLQRRFEERSAQMYQKGKFGGFLHLYIGQEAVSSGINHILNPDDDVITAYRDHGWGLVRGISPEQGMAEMFGKGTGCSSGKGGSMHFFNTKDHFWGGHAIVGAHLPLAAGIAFANKYQENGRIAVCLFGDGAIDQGSLNESFNLAKLWNLPVIYIVENNGYSMGTATHRHSAAELYKRSAGYDIPSKVVNGMDLFSVMDEIKEVADEVRENQSPYFIEIRTYRYRGHSMSDPGTYRSKDELNEFKEIDPIERLKTYMTKHKIAKKDEIVEWQENIDKDVLAAIDFAEESDEPDPKELYEDVYAENDFPYLT